MNIPKYHIPKVDSRTKTITSNTSLLKKPNLEEQRKKNRWEKGSDEDENDDDDDEQQGGLEGLLVKEGLDEIYEDDDDGNSKTRLLEMKQRKPFLSVSRASMMILTCISILAVDFVVFPRRFAKVETFRTSLVRY